jgi:hypothetical protein
MFHGACFWTVTHKLRPFISSFLQAVDRVLQAWVVDQNDIKESKALGLWKGLPETLLVTYPGCLEQLDHLDEPWRVGGQSYDNNPKADTRPRQNFSIWFPVSLHRQFVIFFDTDTAKVRNGGQSKKSKKVYLNVPLGDIVLFSTFIRHAGAPSTTAETLSKQLNFGMHRYVDFITGKLGLDRVRTKVTVGIDLENTI